MVVSACGYLMSGRFRYTGKPYRTHGHETSILKASEKINQVKESRSQHHIPVCNPISVASTSCKSRTTTLLSPQKIRTNSEHTQGALTVNVAKLPGTTVTTLSPVIRKFKELSSLLMELRSVCRVLNIIPSIKSIPNRAATRAVKRTALYVA